MNATTVYVSLTMARRRSEAEPDGHGSTCGVAKPHPYLEGSSHPLRDRQMLYGFAAIPLWGGNTPYVSGRLPNPLPRRQMLYRICGVGTPSYPGLLMCLGSARPTSVIQGLIAHSILRALRCRPPPAPPVPSRDARHWEALAGRLHPGDGLHRHLRQPPRVRVPGAQRVLVGLCGSRTLTGSSVDTCWLDSKARWHAATAQRC
jgi:hypothetical protein